MASSADDILSWTNQDARESQLFNSWGVTYRFQTTVGTSGQSVTTLWRMRTNNQDRVAKLEWSPTGGLGRAIIGKNTVPMADLVRPDPRVEGGRVFNGPDGVQYRWRPRNSELILQDATGNVVAFWKPIRPTRYPQFGDVYGELHFIRTAGTGTVTHPPIMDKVIITAMLCRFCTGVGL